MVSAIISRMGASNRSGQVHSLTIIRMLFSVQVLRLSGSDWVLFVTVDFLKLLPFFDLVQCFDIFFEMSNFSLVDMKV